eukprot:Sspe_Gene.101939::Locus_76625_Transcript_1_1_Confidence_1.000_Length_524::g.101939::m.101939
MVSVPFSRNETCGTPEGGLLPPPPPPFPPRPYISLQRKSQPQLHQLPDLPSVWCCWTLLKDFPHESDRGDRERSLSLSEAYPGAPYTPCTLCVARLREEMREWGWGTPSVGTHG